VVLSVCITLTKSRAGYSDRSVFADSQVTIYQRCGHGSGVSGSTPAGFCVFSGSGVTLFSVVAGVCVVFINVVA